MQIIRALKRYQTAFLENPSALLWFSVATFLYYTGFSFYFTVFNLYLSQIGFTQSVIGTVLSARSFGSVLMVIPAALIVNKVGYKNNFLLAMGLAVSVQTIILLTKSVPLLILLSGLLGCGDALFMIGIAPFIMDHTKEQYRNEIFSVNNALQTFAAAGGAFLTFVSGFLGISNPVTLYRDVMWTGVLCAISGLLVVFFRVQTQAHTALSNPFTKEHLSNLHGFVPLLLVLIVPRTLVGLGASLIIPFMNLYFKDTFHLPGPQIGLIYTFGQLATAAGMLLAPLLVTRIGKVKTVVITEILSLPFMFILARAGGLIYAVPSFLARQALMNMSTPVSQQFNMEITPAHFRTITNGLMSMGDNLSRALGSLIAGYLIQFRGYSYSFYAAMVLYLISAIFYYVFLSPWDRKQSQ
jgi:MFS family permease